MWRPILGLLLALAAFELGLRQLNHGHQSLDPRFGWVWRSVTVVHRLNEGWGVSHWRDDATRDRPPAPADAPRILVAGDSFTEALQVDDDEAFTGRLRGVQALNIGRSAHAIPDYIAFAKEYRAQYRPTWTVVEVGPPDFAEDAFEPAKTHFDDRLGVVVVPPRFGRLSRMLMTARARSALLDNALIRWQMFRSTAKMPPIFRAADAEAQSETPKPVRTWPVGDEMQLVLRPYDGRVTFLFLPPFDAPSPVESQFLQTCAAQHLSCVDLRSAFAEFHARGDAPFGFPNSRPGAGHLNARGHAAAALLLERELEGLRARGLF